MQDIILPLKALSDAKFGSSVDERHSELRNTNRPRDECRMGVIHLVHEFLHAISCISNFVRLCSYGR